MQVPKKRSASYNRASCPTWSSLVNLLHGPALRVEHAILSIQFHWYNRPGVSLARPSPALLGPPLFSLILPVLCLSHPAYAPNLPTSLG